NIRLYPYRNLVKAIKKELVANKKEGLDLNPAWVDGGNVLFAYDEQMPMVCFKRKGKGLVCVIGDDALFMKKNFIYFGKELVDLQCTLIKALVNKDEKFLKSIDWNYLGEIL
ncbi:MAG: hypothetical protein JXA79_05260, partial [Deltaproteobacteria bacterium]|nr:hypothetical protein [Deltaproteobacteria bacterium]